MEYFTLENTLETFFLPFAQKDVNFKSNSIENETQKVQKDKELI